MANAGSATVDTDGMEIFKGEARAIFVYILGTANNSVSVNVSSVHGPADSMTFAPTGPIGQVFTCSRDTVTITAKALANTETVYFSVVEAY